MAREPIGHDQLCPQKITGTENLGDFRCSDPEFEEYLRVSALYDQSVGMGRTYAFMHEGLIAGYIVLAAAHVPDTEQKRLNIDTYGPVPGLVISHLARTKNTSAGAWAGTWSCGPSTTPGILAKISAAG